jgi:hypothetical protein
MSALSSAIHNTGQSRRERERRPRSGIDGKIKATVSLRAVEGRKCLSAHLFASVTLTVTDNWPEDVPVTEAEIAVFEAWFGELFDELFGEG